MKLPTDILPPFRQTDVLIVGGGIIGAACAYELSMRGVQVTVIDKGEMGHGCSYGNAGWMTPCFAMPLPMPGMFFKSVGWLLEPNGPLYIKPAWSLLLLRWLSRFLFSMNHTHLQRSVRALVEISQYSLEFYKELDLKSNGALGFTQNGLLMACQTQKGLNSAIQELELVRNLGVPGKALSPEEARALEPALTGALKGAVYFSNEAHAEPLAVVQTLLKAAADRGALILPHTEVFEWQVESRPLNHGGPRVHSVRTTRGLIQADRYVLATGSWSEAVGQQLGLSIPVLGGKGYALIVKPLAKNPKIPLMLVEKKIAVTPRAHSLRLAGTLELVNRDDVITTKRVDAILKGSREFLEIPTNPDDLDIREVWRGLRPCTPDGVPVIDRSPRHQNLFLATGHQMLGLQSAPGSARLLADLLLGESPRFNPIPFRATRF